MIQKIKIKLREWLLTEDEREIVARVDELESDVKKTRQEWSELHRAMEDADVIEDGAVVENADILVLTGRSHAVQGGEYGKPLYINGRNHHISGLTLKGETDD